MAKEFEKLYSEQLYDKETVKIKLATIHKK
jgi:hypothetical protein